MSPKPLKLATAVLVSTALTMIGVAEACAPSTPSGGHSSGNYSGGGHVTVSKPSCVSGVGKSGGITINKPVTINKNVTINKDININKSVTINKTIDASKNISINKSIVINKGDSGSAAATAFATAYASASANASANTNIVIYGGGYNEYVTVNPVRGEIGAIAVTAQQSAQCVMQDATVIKSVHAVCLSADGREFPASHMVGETWLDSGYEGEVLRCIPGAHLKITVGDVLQSDQGLAGTYQNGKVLECASSEALRHFKDGMLKCVPKVAVKDCTERTNLRRWGTGDMFFTFRTQVCVEQKTVAKSQSRAIELDGLTLNGGVGEQ